MRFPKMTGEARPQLPHMTSRHCRTHKFKVLMVIKLPYAIKTSYAKFELDL